MDRTPHPIRFIKERTPDDNYEDEQAVKHHYVREALDAILAN